MFRIPNLPTRPQCLSGPREALRELYSPSAKAWHVLKRKKTARIFLGKMVRFTLVNSELHTMDN